MESQGFASALSSSLLINGSLTSPLHNCYASGFVRASLPYYATFFSESLPVPVLACADTLRVIVPVLLAPPLLPFQVL